MRVLFVFVTFTMMCVYIAVGLNVRRIWPDQPEAHFQIQEMIYSFGAGVFFTMFIWETIRLAKENR